MVDIGAKGALRQPLHHLLDVLPPLSHAVESVDVASDLPSLHALGIAMQAVDVPEPGNEMEVKGGMGSYNELQ